MKKIIYYVLLLIAFCQTIEAQIGINTENPQTLFHIDVLGNNANTPPSIAQQLDDVYMGTGYNDEAVLSLGEIPQSNMQLALNDKNKAFLPNKVALTSQLDVNTVPNPVRGMIVYNTSNVSGTNGLIPGIYVYEDNTWKLLFTEEMKRLQTRNLVTEAVTPVCTAANYNCALKLDFGDDIIIPETGAYGVGVTLLLKTNVAVTDPARQVVYLWLMSGDTPIDSAELNMTGFVGSGSIGATYTVFLGGKFNVGDILNLRIANYSGSPNSYVFPSKTNMVYWRLTQPSS